MCCIRSLINFIALAIVLFSGQVIAQPMDDFNEDEAYAPLTVDYPSAVELIKKVQSLEEFPPLEHLKMDFREPPIMEVDSTDAVARVIKQKFLQTQKFLFGGRSPFKIKYCNPCDMEPRIHDDLVVYINHSYMGYLLNSSQLPLIDLHLAHSLSHYVLELYLTTFSVYAPGGSVSRIADPSWFGSSKNSTLEDKYIGRARYHAEVDTIAAASLLMRGLEVPDFKVVVDRYRDNWMLSRRRHMLPPFEIYSDQEVRVNTIRWIRQNWPSCGTPILSATNPVIAGS